MSNSPPIIVGLGEALYDMLPSGPELGGAPLNAVVQAHRLGSLTGGNASTVVSRIGHDKLGQTLLGELASRGIDTSFIQIDHNAPTGTVKIKLQGTEPEYEIIRDVAWDRLSWDDSLASLARRCDAVCYGTMSQRTELARLTIQQFVNTATQAVRLLDLNLRQDYFSVEVLETSFQSASIVKMNGEELTIVASLLGLDQTSEPIPRLIDQFELDLFVLTRGKLGTALHTADSIVAGQAVQFEPESNADSVGAGDACSAAVLHGMIRNWPLQKMADLANRLGAFVASRKGATPTLPTELIASGNN